MDAPRLAHLLKQNGGYERFRSSCPAECDLRANSNFRPCRRDPNTTMLRPPATRRSPYRDKGKKGACSLRVQVPKYEVHTPGNDYDSCCRNLRSSMFWQLGPLRVCRQLCGNIKMPGRQFRRSGAGAPLAVLQLRATAPQVRCNLVLQQAQHPLVCELSV